MSLCFLLGQEKTGRFNHVFSANFAPLQIGRVFLGSYADSFSIHYQLTVFYIDRTFETTMNGIITEHVSHVVNIDKVINPYHFDVFSVLGCTEHPAADAAKSVDTNFDF